MIVFSLSWSLVNFIDIYFITYMNCITSGSLDNFFENCGLYYEDGMGGLRSISPRPE